jgi:hypothetical protein
MARPHRHQDRIASEQRDRDQLWLARRKAQEALTRCLETAARLGIPRSVTRPQLETLAAGRQAPPALRRAFAELNAAVARLKSIEQTQARVVVSPKLGPPVVLSKHRE